MQTSLAKLLRALMQTALTLGLLLSAGQSQAQTTQPETTQPETGQPQADQFRAKQNITPGFKIVSGDIQVRENLAPEATFERNLWPGGIVFYEFDSNVIQANRDAMLAAMNEWSRISSVVFRAGRGQLGLFSIYIHIQNSTGNNSALGMIPNGQILNMSSWGSRFVMVHELGHALGLHHEHERPDRDSFVAIIAGNIQGGRENQFTKLPNGTPIYGPYDFDSVMHYDRCSFSTACPAGATCNCAVNQETIQVLGAANNAAWQSKIGQRDHISYLDGRTISFLYPFGNWRFVDATNSASGQNGSFLNPYQSLAVGINATPVRGTLWIQGGLYRDVRRLTKTMSLRAPLGGVRIQPVNGVAGGPEIASVSAASYNGELAVEAIAAAFGENLAAGVIIASTLPLPTTLGGVTIKVKDSAGVERDAPLFFVSPAQVNYQIPAGTSVGVAQLALYKNGTIVATGSTPVVEASPGLFSANASGQGVPAATLFRLRADGSQSYEALARYDAAQQRYVALPIDLGAEGDQVFLILFGTGLRGRTDLTTVAASIGEEPAEVLYAGAAPGFIGLDQANIRLPRSLAGKGDVQLFLTADQRSSNAVTINIR